MPRRNSENNDRRTEQFRKLFIGGLTPQTTVAGLKNHFQQFGEIVDCIVMKDPHNNRSRGFGFVTYKEPEMVDVAQAARPHEIDGKVVEAKRAMPREDSNSPECHMTVKKLFVGGLKKDVTREELIDYFSKFGPVAACEIVLWKESQLPRGFAFVTFEDYDSVDKAVLYKPHHIGSSRADVKKAFTKEQMSAIEKRQTRVDYNNDYGGGYYPMGGSYMGNDGGYPPYGGPYNNTYGANGGNPSNYAAGGYDNCWGQGGSGWHQGGMGDGFGHYGNQNYSGGPVRSAPHSGYQRNAPYGGGYGRR